MTPYECFQKPLKSPVEGHTETREDPLDDFPTPLKTILSDFLRGVFVEPPAGPRKAIVKSPLSAPFENFQFLQDSFVRFAHRVFFFFFDSQGSALPLDSGLREEGSKKKLRRKYFVLKCLYPPLSIHLPVKRG
jgi:hypothetical protein